MVDLLRRFFGSLALLWWCFSCVNVQEPEGGPPDEVPPKLVAALPKNGSLQFKGKKVVATFSKPIVVKDIYRKLLIRPQLEKRAKKPSYTYAVRGKKLTLTFQVPLKKDATYVLQFNDAVRDQHEGLQAIDSVLTFSTGRFIDAITAQGRVYRLRTNLPMEQVNVCLYDAERPKKDWQEEKGIPDYFATTDKEGKFTIEHIRMGKYYVRATTGKHDKYQIDYEKDSYGFFKEPIDLTRSVAKIAIPMVENDIREMKVLRSVPEEGLCKVICSKKIEKYRLAIASYPWKRCCGL